MLRLLQYLVLFCLWIGMMIMVSKIIFPQEQQAIQEIDYHSQKVHHLALKNERHPMVFSALYEWMNQPVDLLQEVYGEPLRKDLSAFGYTWWVYTDGMTNYIQFGIEDDMVRTIFATGSKVGLGDIVIGQHYQDIAQILDFSQQITYQNDQSSFTFKLTDEDLQAMPLVKITDQVFLQCYFDTITQKLSSIRLLTGDILLLHLPYEVSYRGQLPQAPTLNEEEWQHVQRGMAEQIYLLTNVKRYENDLPPLKWDEQISEVAFLHSYDMEKNQYFSHDSLNGNGLKERLDAYHIIYLSAGENIAAQHPDGPAAIEGWLNSQTHREALLSPYYTHLGVGVYRHYFTQNFIAKFEQ